MLQDYGLPKFNDDDESLCSEEGQESMKVVRMVKTDEPLVSQLHTLLILNQTLSNLECFKYKAIELKICFNLK